MKTIIDNEKHFAIKGEFLKIEITLLQDLEQSVHKIQ